MKKANKIAILFVVIGVALISYGSFNLKGNKIELNDGKTTYTISFNSNGGSTVDSQNVLEGERVSKPTDPTKKDYSFVEWQLNGKGYDFNTTVTKDITLVANWKSNTKEKYIVTFNSGGGSKIESQTVIDGGKVIKPTNPTKKDYSFVEWQLNGKSYDFNTTVTKNITLEAVWANSSKKLYTIKFNSDGGSSVDAKTVIEGNNVSEPNNPTKSGYLFVEWQLDGRAYDFNTNVTKDFTLVAIWKKDERKQYTITFDSNGGSSVSKQTIYEKNKVVKPTNPTRSGYTFVEWQLDGRAYDFNSPVTKNITLVANWKVIPKKTFTVTFNSNGGSSVSNQTITEGSKVTKPTNPTRSGYTFVEWQLDGRAYDFNTPVTKNITLMANWREIVYTIKATSVDPYSPEVTLKVYNGSTEVTNYKSINYGSASSVVICTSDNPTAGRSDYDDETSFVVVLNDGTRIKAIK